MTTIPWIRCTDRMPPDDENFKLIFKGNKDLATKNHSGADLHLLKQEWCVKWGLEWIPYDEATWKELNK